MSKRSLEAIAAKDFHFREIWHEAYEAGQRAAEECRPKPMHVGVQRADGTFAHLETIEDGVCGFAWINVKPGNSPFANWLKRNDRARKDHYYGGVTIWVGEYQQSLERKAAHAQAFAMVLQQYGIKAYASSRMD